jgi:hypothetical protein
MARLVAAMASSHAYTFYAPEDWDRRYERSRANYARINGEAPPEHPRRAAETLESDRLRFVPVRAALERLKSEFAAADADALLILGDDQAESYPQVIPQFAIHLGGQVDAYNSESGATSHYACDSDLSHALARALMEDGFDMAVSRSFPNDRLVTHAHAQILDFLNPRIPVVLVFINAVCPPAPTPARCFAFGQALARAIREAAGDRRVVAYASGGLSHFSSDYPLAEYGGALRMGAICEEFDSMIVEWMKTGQGARLAGLSSRDLIENGALEHRQWIALLGMLGERKPEWLVHAAFHRAIMDMGVAYWRLRA